MRDNITVLFLSLRGTLSSYTNSKDFYIENVFLDLLYSLPGQTYVKCIKVLFSGEILITFEFLSYLFWCSVEDDRLLATDNNIVKL